MATYLRHMRLRILVTLHEFTARISTMSWRYVAGPERVDVQRAAGSVLPSRALTPPWACADGESGSSRSIWSQSSSASGAHMRK
jgi:hypothetical protein